MKRPFLIGLTGSIGMGKSTTAGIFAEEGASVWDADAAVHRLYARGGAAVEPIRALCPEAVIDGSVDRDVLKDWISRDETALQSIEIAVHPLVARDRCEFVKQSTADVIVLDIPLLFETGNEVNMDMVVIVSAPAEVQRARVLARPGMTVDRLDAILSKQMPDAEKHARADRVIETGSICAARHAVRDILSTVRKERANA